MKTLPDNPMKQTSFSLTKGNWFTHKWCVRATPSTLCGDFLVAQRKLVLWQVVGVECAQLRHHSGRYGHP